MDCHWQNFFYQIYHTVDPGMAGWACHELFLRQDKLHRRSLVKQGYGASKGDALLKLQYDLYYIKHPSLT
jgi:hypothetical protein